MNQLGELSCSTHRPPPEGGQDKILTGKYIKPISKQKMKERHKNITRKMTIVDAS